MSDDFFDKIDKQLNDQEALRKQKAESSAANSKFCEEAIRQARPIADKYVEKLTSRGIDAEVSGHDSYFTVRLRWPDFDELEIAIGVDHKDKKAKIQEYHKEKSNRYKYGEYHINPDSWSLDKYEERLKKVISDFMAWSDRHGGALKR